LFFPRFEPWIIQTVAQSLYKLEWNTELWLTRRANLFAMQ